ncbi:MAG: polysaccharide biosynthesis C-terminal domain-containing protein [Parvibaculum sp.]
MSDTGLVRPLSVFSFQRLRALFVGSEIADQRLETILLFLLRGAGAVFAFLTQIAIARWAGADSFGIYAIAWTWIIVLGTLAQGGFGISMTRFVTRYGERGRYGRSWKVIGFAASFVGGVSLCIALAGAVFVLMWGEAVLSARDIALLIAMAAVPLYAFSELGKGVLRGLGDNAMAYAPGYLVRPLLLFVLVAVGAFMAAQGDFDLDPVFILSASFASLAIVALWQWGRIVWRRRGNLTANAGCSRWHARHWLAVSLPMVMVDGHYLLVSYMDLLVLDLFVPAEEVARYFAAVKIIALVWFVPFAVSGIGARVLAKSFERGNGPEFEEAVHRFAHWSFWPTFGLALVLSLFGEYVLLAFGAVFEDGIWVLRLLALGLVLQAACGPVKFLMTMTSEQNASAIILIGTALANVGLNFSLIPIWGLEGAAVATVVTQTLASGLMVLQAKRKLGVWSFVMGGLFSRQKTG